MKNVQAKIVESKFIYNNALKGGAIYSDNSFIFKMLII